MEFTGFTCQFGIERREWDTPRAADAAAVRQLFDARPVRWSAVAAGAVPSEPSPTRLGHQLVRI
jgi:hypothetical protein